MAMVIMSILHNRLADSRVPGIFLPNHPPEIYDGGWETSLRGDVAPGGRLAWYLTDGIIGRAGIGNRV